MARREPGLIAEMLLSITSRGRSLFGRVAVENAGEKVGHGSGGMSPRRAA